MIGPLNLAANGNLVLSSTPIGALNSGNTLTLFAKGAFSAGTATLQADPDGTGNWVPTGVALTADGLAQIPWRAYAFRIVLSGAGAPNINFWVV